MGHVVVLNLIFFAPAVSGAVASALLMVRFLRASAPPAWPDGSGGSGPIQPNPHSAGPDDLARSA